MPDNRRQERRRGEEGGRCGAARAAAQASGQAPGRGRRPQRAKPAKDRTAARRRLAPAGGAGIHRPGEGAGDGGGSGGRSRHSARDRLSPFHAPGAGAGRDAGAGRPRLCRRRAPVRPRHGGADQLHAARRAPSRAAGAGRRGRGDLQPHHAQRRRRGLSRPRGDPLAAAHAFEPRLARPGPLHGDRQAAAQPAAGTRNGGD